MRAIYRSNDLATASPRYLRDMENSTQEQLAADKRTLRIIWLAIVSGVVMLSAIMTFLLQSGAGGTVSQGNVFFTLNAALNIASILLGFTIQRKLDAALTFTKSYAEAAGLIRSRCIISLAVVEASALFAAVATFLTGDLLNLAFVVPFFAFSWLFFPSDSRFAYWQAMIGDER